MKLVVIGAGHEPAPLPIATGVIDETPLDCVERVLSVTVPIVMQPRESGFLEQKSVLAARQFGSFGLAAQKVFSAAAFTGSDGAVAVLLDVVVVPSGAVDVVTLVVVVVLFVVLVVVVVVVLVCLPSAAVVLGVVVVFVLPSLGPVPVFGTHTVTPFTCPVDWVAGSQVLGGTLVVFGDGWPAVQL
jgi:hypothetical protein